jgi:Flp pilus assembly protein TadB
MKQPTAVIAKESGMSQPHTDQTTSRPKGGHRGHGWMMIACCVPMLAIAIVLVATGVLGGSFIFAAVMCTAMMVMMMRMMSQGSDNGGEPR